MYLSTGKEYRPFLQQQICDNFSRKRFLKIPFLQRQFVQNFLNSVERMIHSFYTINFYYKFIN